MRTFATVTLVVAAIVCTAAQYNGRCPPNFDLAAATFPVGQGPTPCRSTADCPRGRQCCPALSSKTDLCLFPVTGNGPFPGSPVSVSRPQVSRPVTVNNPHGGSQCPANFNLAAAIFPVGQSPSPCSRNRDCPRGQLCCPALGSSSDLCLSPVPTGLPGIPGSVSRPISFPGQAYNPPHVAGQCPPPLNLALVRFSAGLPIYCEGTSGCPRGQLCCPAINPRSNICREPVFNKG